MKNALAVALAASIAAGCAATPPNPRDPWEGFNRPMHQVNDAVDRAVVKPVAEGYAKVTPGFAQEGIGNFFENINDVGTGLNNLLQGKGREGAGDLGRFVVNSTLGILGLWDVATPMGLAKHNEDFGQTLGWWGVPSGPFLVLPLLGPSTLRDAPARWVDPSISYNRAISDVAVRNSLYALDGIRQRASLLKAGKVLEEAALDPYAFTRDAWVQRRRNLVFDGKPPKGPDDE